MISINGKKKEKKKKKKKEEEVAADDEGVIGDCVGNLLATVSTGHRSCFVVFFFSLSLFFLCFFVLFCFFFFFEELVFFFSGSFFFFFFLTNLFVQDLKLLDLLPIFVLLHALSFFLDLIIISYRCIGQNSPGKLK